ncbi:hypothetical protein LTR37_012982 [Vermiconidia calcicola]|uniref:Uncharacterized protein n=1 Tax=Vermiconidia calcicola TaxID=1690605 RepID=A0ACC3MXL4_9PEZI|nr:hypothetical protein LTR37_012982 [Vermiconidia calcicola]
MPTEPKERAKRRHYKTRTGCSTCKRRHFKCDERKPNCLRCTLDGKECTYNVPPTKLFPESRPAESTEETSQQLPLESPSRSLHVDNDPAEQRALCYFRERTAPGMTGFTSYTDTFWRSLIPGLSESEPAIRHIVIAISSKYEATRSASADAASLDTLCIKHYSHALGALSKPAVSEEVLLVSCVAFTAFERLQDPTTLSGQYLEYVIAALKILRERTKSPSPPSMVAGFSLVNDFIGPMFFQVQLLSEETVPEIPRIFLDLQTARDWFFRICIWRYVLSHRGEQWLSTSSSFLEIRSLMKKWHQVLDASFSASSIAADIKLEKQLSVLKRQVHPLMGSMLYSARIDVPEYCYFRPTLVYLSLPSRIAVFIPVDPGQKVNLTGINRGRPATSDDAFSPWPHAKRVTGPNTENFIELELSAIGAVGRK